MDIIANLFNGLINWSIIISGFTVLLFWVINAYQLADKKNRIDEELSQKNRKTTIDRETRVLNEEVSEKQVSDFNLDKIREFKKAFNKLCSWHNAISQLIPIFPLMGVFGTVWGLMKQVQAKDVDAMLSSLNMALTTTIWGLLFAIILKIIDALWSSRIINDVEVLFEDFDIKIENTNLLNNISLSENKYETEKKK